MALAGRTLRILTKSTIRLLCSYIMKSIVRYLLLIQEQEDTFKPNAGLFERFHQSLDNELVDVLKPCRLDPSSLCKLKDRRDDKFTDKLRKQLKK